MACTNVYAVAVKNVGTLSITRGPMLKLVTLDLKNLHLFSKFDQFKNRKKLFNDRSGVAIVCTY